MTKKHRQSGFSLTEVVFAIATLAIGMLFVGGTFMLGVHFSRVSTEQSIAPVVAEEAFAKLRLYYKSLSSIDDSKSWFVRLSPYSDHEYQYPSVNDNTPKQYHWTAIRRGDPPNREFTVFVMRQNANEQIIPEISRAWSATDPNIMIDPNIMDGMTVVRDDTGELLRASVERSTGNVTFSPEVTNDPKPGVWFVKSSDGRNPCIGVYQRTIRF